jgi:hypothetical protein
MMEIKTSVRIVKAKPEAVNEIESLTSGKHDIAWSENLDKHVMLSGDAYTTLNNQFRTQSITGLPKNYLQYLQNTANAGGFNNVALAAKADSTPKISSKEIQKAYMSLTANSASLIRQYFPEEMNAPIQSMEFIFASYSAIDAWSDPLRKNNIRASMATGKAIIEAIDVFAPFFPSLRQIQPATAIAGVALKTAESAYLVYSLNQK